MGFLVQKLAWSMLRPSSLLLILLLAGVVMRRWRVGDACLWSSLVGFAAVALLPASWLLLRPLEDRFPAAPLPDRIDGVILLGGAVDPTMTAARAMPAVNGDAARMLRAIEIARRAPDASILFTGGRGVILPGALTEADVTRQIFAQIGFARPVIYEDAARTTHENAVMLRRLVQPRPDQTWVLVTSARHMPRAMGLFQAAGWHVLAEPTSYVSAGWRLEYGKSFPRKLTELDQACHEWAGLIAARIAGQTHALFPAP